mmetsp:Transcript_27195/g.29297  ORF Transcript_27195/g.29297 Transcript_27195/m.29297 type:complete len:616 (-) Transcript_27195:551-2398(-)
MMSSFCLILFIFLFIVLLSTDRRKNDNERGGNGDIGDSGGGVIHVVVTALSLTTSTCTTCSSRNSISTTCSRRISSTSFTFSKGSESFPFRSSATTNSIYATDPKQGEKIFEKILTPTSSSSEEEEEAERGIIGPFTLLLTSQFLLFIGVGAVIPSIPLYGKEIGLSGAANGIIISAPAVALFLAANWSGRRADLARKPAMMIGMAIIAISDVGTALAQALPSLIVARLGLGAGRALSEAGERGMLLDFSNRMKKMRGRALALQQIVVALGIGIGAPLGGIVVERYGPRAAFYCVSVAAVIALILYAFLPETIVRVKGGGVPPVVVIQKDDTEKRSSKSTASSLSRSSTATATATATTSISISTKEEEGILLLNENTSGIQVWNELLKDNQWRGLVLCQSGASWGYAAKIASIPILAADTLPGGAAGAGLLISAAALSGLIGAPIGGFLTDRIGSKGTAVIGGVVSSVGLICIPLALQLTADTTQAINLSITTIHDNYLVLPMEIVVGGVLLQSKALFFSLAVLLWSMGVSAQGPALTALAQENCRPGVEATSLSLAKASIDGTYIVAPFILGLVTDALMEVPGIECAFAGSLVFVGTLALAILVQNTDDLECPV